MIQLAFKIAAATGELWSELIAKQSNSIYSHVEIWLSGPQNKALCFSSREPDGACFKTIDLSNSNLWTICSFITTRDQEININGFCLGTNGKWYDGIGLIGYKTANPTLHDPHAVFCSEVVAEIAKYCVGRILSKEPWLISPGELFTLNKGWN